MKDIDEEISKVISAKIYEPEGYKNAIETALYKENIKSPKTYFYKMIAIVCCCLILLSGVVYASYAIIKNVFNNRKGVETAINNNYIMDGLQEYHESNGIAVKINNILMDDYNLDISFNIKSDKEIKVEDTQLIRFEKIIIIDEENNVLFYDDNQKALEDFIKKYKLNIKVEEYEENYINPSKSMEVRNKNGNQLDLIYNISAYENSYPKSKEIFIYAENIILNESKVIVGTWQIKHEMDEKFYDREKVVYSCENLNDDNIANIKVITYATGTNIEIEMYMNEENDIETMKKILSKINNQAKNENSNIYYNDDSLNAFIENTKQSYKKIENIYIENSNGIKFYQTEGLNESDTISVTENQDKIIYYDILDMTIYDCTQIINLHFVYNDKEYNVKLIN